MKRLIPTYIAASNLLFQRNKRGPKRNATVDLFSALTPEDSTELENGNRLPSEALERLSQETGLHVDECARLIDLFLYWRAKSI
jgi:hypothetical protein